MNVREAIKEIMRIKKENNFDLFDACIQFCEDHQIEVEDFFEFIKEEKMFMDYLKYDCIRNRRVIGISHSTVFDSNGTKESEEIDKS